ncbi:hypothetical protein [Paraburkholderia graminis]|uniref:hypothetical protein n=1 Tax=Paraburkholderia graminis TaxID=60548 RepID=UPI0038B914AF
MKKSLIAAIVIALSTTTAAHAKDMPDAEFVAISKAWNQRCADFAAGEGRPSLEKTCMDGVKAGIKEVVQMGKDDTVSEQMWDICKAESGFNYSNDFHAWAACMRIARTRPGLRDY